MKKTILDIPLGSYDSCEEFQVGTTLIWVHTDVLGISESVRKANNSFDDFWNKKSQAVEWAETESRKKYPQLWDDYDVLCCTQNLNVVPLKVYGIHYYPNVGLVRYEINSNTDCIIEMPNDWIMVEMIESILFKVYWDK